MAKGFVITEKENDNDGGHFTSGNGGDLLLGGSGLYQIYYCGLYQS